MPLLRQALLFSDCCYSWAIFDMILLSPKNAVGLLLIEAQEFSSMKTKFILKVHIFSAASELLRDQSVVPLLLFTPWFLLCCFRYFSYVAKMANVTR